MARFTLEMQKRIAKVRDSLIASLHSISYAEVDSPDGQLVETMLDITEYLLAMGYEVTQLYDWMDDLNEEMR